MFDLVPFRSRSRKGLSESRRDPFNNMISDIFDDVMDFADRSFRADIKEKEDEYLIEAEMPGMKKDDIQLEIDENYLTITADHKEETEEKGENYIRRERRQGRYARSFYIENVKEDDIKAEYNDGILTVHLPKLEKSEPKKRTIDIE